MTGEEKREPEWMQVAVKKVEELRFGTVQIVVHNGQVTQIESTEKIRFTDPNGARDRKDS
jgi:hypothetical protein